MTHWVILSIVVTIVLMVQAIEQEGESHHHHQFEEEAETRVKRDVLKGKNHDLVRSKRYIGRVPVSYMKKAIDFEPYDENEDNILSGSQKQSPSASHFREFQMRQGYNRQPLGFRDNEVEEPRALPSGGLAQSHKSQRRYIPNLNARDEGDTTNLTDEEIQTLLLMLDGYELNGNHNEQKNNAARVQSVKPEQYYSYLSPMDLERVAQMYAVGKRETGKRSPKNYEQPMSFDNSLYPGDKLEFLNEKRKRIGSQNLIAKATSSNRFKKETDPAVVATLEKVFTQANNPEKVASYSNSNSKHPAVISSQNSLNHEITDEKSKKSIDWSNYLGIDKRTNEKAKSEEASSVQQQKGNEENKKIESQSSESSPSVNIKSTQILSSPSVNPNNQVDNKAKLKQSNDKNEQQRKENETHNKEEEDRNWILQEFYKNFAMSTNVKRKRESPASLKPKSELEKLEELEKKMADAGDKIIWDALKYGGAHRDEKLSPAELAKIKSNIIQKLSTAYSLEKVREAVDELREQILRLEERQRSKE